MFSSSESKALLAISETIAAGVILDLRGSIVIDSNIGRHPLVLLLPLFAIVLFDKVNDVIA
jgi:hypothetical protein